MAEFWALLLAKLAKITEFGLLASYGAAANYVYTMLKSEDQRFSLPKFLGLLFLATFVGNVIGGFIPHASPYRDELLMGFGFCTFPVLAVLEVKVKGILVKYLEKVG